MEFLKHYKKTIAGVLAALGLSGAGYGVANLGAIATIGDYQVISGVRGYVTKPDPTNIPPDYLVAGSQNVIINDQEKAESRSGYELFGKASTTARAIDSDFVWKHSGATSTDSAEIFLRSTGSVLQFATSTAFLDLYDQISTSTPPRFATIWSTTELIDVLLFVNASSTLFEWSGATATYASSTATSVGIQEVIGESRFYLQGTRHIRVLDSSGVWRTFTYTGQGVSTFSGITPDPTSFTFNVDAPVVQAIRSNVNTPAFGFTSNVIKVLNNQAFIGSHTSRRMYVSKDTAYTNFTFSSPRVIGEGALITLDDITIGMESPDDDKLIVFSGNDRVYQITMEVSPGSTADREVPRVKPLLVSTGQGAISQELIGKIKQAVVWVSNNKELVELGQVENLPSPQAVAISDPIKPDFDSANFTNGEIEFWKNDIFITAPPDGKVFIFDLSKRFWQPPQILGIRRVSVFGGELYGHSQSVPETYKLFTGLNDNENSISAKAHFAYQNGGRRDVLKNFDRYYTELYLASNTKVDVSILYEWLGAKSIITYELDGASQDFLFNPSADASLGVNPLGTNPLGGLTEGAADLAKYRRFRQLVPVDNFEYQVRFEMEQVDGAFQLLAHGANSRLSPNAPVKIVK